MELFSHAQGENFSAIAPLAVRMRPHSLDEFVGQEAILGPGKLLRRMLDADRLGSSILHGPPGCGKTTLARLLAAHTQSEFVSLHAAEAGVKDVRQVLEAARARVAGERRRTVVFLDEIHRFSRSQQDVLLRDMEEGVIVLLGATTENPYFAINGPILSRSTVFELRALTEKEIAGLLRRALTDRDRGLGGLGLQAEPAAIDLIARQCAGDTRKALNALEIAARSTAAESSTTLTMAAAAASMQQPAIQYDSTGDVHYDVASALIKSMRGGDPDAALYWLARMLEGGEDPRFIIRRIAICASEDVGNADPLALLIASAAIQTVELVGLPECEFALAQAAVYVACAAKSNASALGIWAARDDVRKNPPLPVPPHLRSSGPPSQRAYIDPHSFPEEALQQDYLGAARVYYNPTQSGREAEIARRLAAHRAAIAAARKPDSP